MITSIPLRRLRAGAIVLTAAVLVVAALPCRGDEIQKQPLDKDHAAKMAKGLALFQAHVKPLLTERCVRCHGGQRTRGEFDMTDRGELLRGGSSGPAVLPGRGKQSLLYQLITHAREPHMPQFGKKLSADEVQKITEWIDLGAPFDDPLVAREKEPSWTEKVVDPAAKDFWSFRPLQPVTPPPVKDAAWCRTPVDRFILAKLEEKGLAPAPAADRRKLIRRAYFDLIGLPPTPEEVDAFVGDQSPDAWPRLIDRLLASPHYGERWAPHWLDLARFAESHGFEHDYDRPHAYHYRDFVIQAFNNDLPYDTFVRWQLAGDEIEPGNPLANMATGFLAAGVHSTQITKAEVEKHRYDELDDKLNTTGTAFLGLSIGCARCHDHKYDPIPQADYYRLLSTFTTTVRSDMEVDMDPQWYRRAKADFDEEHAPLVAALEEFEREQLPGRLAAWEKDHPDLPPWVILEPTEAKSAGGATLTKQPDGALLAEGKKPDNDTYTVTVRTDAAGITAVRLEALAHPSLVKGGPGRAANGNFALTTFRVAARETGSRGQPVAVGLRNPRATFEQQGLPVAAAIDDNPTSGWAVDPMFGKDHAAVFELATPVGFPKGTELTFTLEFKNNTAHSIARPRLAVTTAQAPVAPQAPGIPEAVRAALAAAPEKRTESEHKALLDWFSRLDPEGQKLHRAIADHLAKAPQPKLEKVLVATEGLPAIRLHTQGGDFFPETYFLRRGDTNNKDGVAKQGFLQVLMQAPEKTARWQAAPPPGWRTSYRRTALANWITDAEAGAGHLLARVIVNRLWQHHLGRGIVATASDFGSRGAPPTHPELLDWLAGDLIDHGWKLKRVHKLIMTSAVYMEDSAADAAQLKADPDNELLGRFHPRRLEGEAIRDTLLSLGGRLDARMFGPGTLDEGMTRRSVYFTVKRSKLIPMLQIFDAPQALTPVGQRPTTTIAPQALWLMNNPHVRRWAAGMAGRIADADTPPEEAVRRGYRLALSREPDARELRQAADFLARQMETYRGDDRRQQALTDFCQVLMCLNELIYVD